MVVHKYLFFIVGQHSFEIAAPRYIDVAPRFM